MYILGKDEAISLEDERFTECRVVKLYYAIYGRYAWNNTWITRYSPGCMNYSFESAKQSVEQQRVQGSVFNIHEIPALHLSNSKLSVIITEINSVKPLQQYQNVSENLTITLCEIYDYFSPLTEHSVVRLIFKNRLRRNCFESISVTTPLRQFQSRPNGSAYPLAWDEKDYNISTISIELLAAKMVALIPPFKVPNMDTPVKKLGLSPRTANTLQNVQIRTLRDLMSISERELLTKQNMGRKSVHEIIDVLSSFGQQLPD